MISNKIFSGYGIKATGVAFPGQHGKFITNSDINHLKFGNNWKNIITEKGHDPFYHKNKYGFESRFWTSSPFNVNIKQTFSSYELLVESASRALESSGLKNDDIGFLITFTATSPYYISSTATRVAGELGLTCPAIEIKAGCSSGLYALFMAYQLLASGCKNILLAGADTLSKVLDPFSHLVFAGGDGGAALILGNVKEYDRGLFAAYLESDGKYANLMHMDGILPPRENDIIGKEFMLQYDSSLNHIIEEKWKMIPEILYKKTLIHPQKIDFYIPHHVNLELMETGRLAAGIETVKTGNYISDIANIGAAGIFYALHRSFQESRIQPGDTVMLAAVGGGLNWGGLVINV